MPITIQSSGHCILDRLSTTPQGRRLKSTAYMGERRWLQLIQTDSFGLDNEELKNRLSDSSNPAYTGETGTE